MKFTAKLLRRAVMDVDMQGPDGSRTLGFTLEIGVPEIPNWEFSLTKLPNGWAVKVQDGKNHNDLKRFPSIEDLRKFLLENAVNAIYEDVKRLGKYNSRIEVLRVRLAKQIDQDLNEVLSEFNRPFEG